MSPEQRIAHYKITGKLGEGGMGAVYRATDTKLGRDVAIKILPDALANDPEYLARFTREAQVLAALNHPHIAAVYGIEERAIVMELVEGRELHTPLPLEEALPVARQIAEALEAAHEKGIVHRDLKPANIKLTAEGNVKVLDFGLAKSVEHAEAGAVSATVSPTLTIGATLAGTIMGTAAYMAPEQAAGKPVDKRADIWAFGVVLYEMLAGGRLFEGETLAHTLADVLRKDIDLAKLPAATPASVRELLARCLDRDPRTRLRDIGEARVLLSRPLAPSAVVPRAIVPRRPLLPWIAAAAIALVAIGEFAWQRLHPAGPPVRAVRFTIPFPEGTEEIPTPAGRTFVPSPDGRQIAFAAMDTHDHQQHLYVRPIDSVTVRRFEKTEGANFPFWSPDSQSVGFFVEQALRRVTVSTGAVQTICEFAGETVNRSGDGAAWGTGGVVLFGTRGPLMRISASGGTPETATELDASAGEFSHAWPQFLPDGQHFLYLARSGVAQRQAIYAGVLGSKQRTLVLRTAVPAAFVPPGFLLFLRESALMAQPFDPHSLRLSGEPAPLGMDVSANEINGRAAFAASENGVLVFRQAGEERSMQLSWYDRAGKRLAAVTKPGVYFGINLSPDGKSASVVTMPKAGHGPSEYLGILDLATGVIAPAGPEATRWSEWAPDSRRLYFSRAGGGVFELALDTGAVTEITADQPLPRLQAVSPDGHLLLLQDGLKTKTYLLPLAAPRKLQLVMDAPFRRESFRISPDGTKVAWSATEATQSQIFVAEFPAFTGKRQVSAEGGAHPEWSRDGRELFYLQDDATLLSVPVQTGAPVRAGIPKLLFPFFPSSHTTPTYAPADDGRFLLSELTGVQGTPMIVAVVNWQAEMKK